MDDIRRTSRFDRLIAGAARLMAEAAGPPAARRPNPADAVVDQPAPGAGTAPGADLLDDDERRLAAGLMRVNHVGEVCAQALYEGHALTVRDARELASHDHGLHAQTVRTPDETPGPTLIRARGLTVSLRAQASPALNHVSIEVAEGSCIGVLGRNGSGKTTLLRALAGIIPIVQGEIDRCADTTVGYVTHDPSSLFTERTLRGELERTRALRSLAPDSELVDRWLNLVRLSHVASRSARTLSGGQRIRAAMATIGVAEDRVLALDEPTRGLDADGQAVLRDVVAYTRSRGGAVLLATHDLELIASLADRIITMSNGRISDEGTPREILTTGLLRPALARIVPDALTLADIPPAR